MVHNLAACRAHTTNGKSTLRRREASFSYDHLISAAEQ
jgi:hypothetical protein